MILRKREQDRVRTLLSAIGAVATLLVIGVVGFMLIERFSFFDALYMTVITLSTVGFMELHPLSMSGRIFTMLLIFGGVGVAFYSLTLVSQTVIEGELFQLRRRKRMEKRIAGYTGHTIVCGFGRLAEAVVREMLEAGEQVVVIESNENFAMQLTEMSVPFVIGSAYEDEILKLANIMKAKHLLALLPKDADNVYISLCARDLNPNLNIVARTEDTSGESKLRRAGASRVIAPYRVAGVKLVHQLIRPHVSEFLELSGPEGSLALEEVVVPANSRVVGKTIAQSELRDRTGAFVAAIVDPDGTSTVNPSAETQIQGGATLIILGKPGSLEAVTGLLSA